MTWSGWQVASFGSGGFHPVTAPGAAGADGQLLVIGEDDQTPYSGDLYESNYLGNGYFTPSSDIGRPRSMGIFGSPAVTQRWDGSRADHFVNAATKLLHRSKQQPYGWSDWEDLGGGPPSGPILGGSPAACLDADGQLDVFCISATGFDLLHKRFRNGWSDWESLGGQFSRLRTPAVQTWGRGRVGVFVVGEDRAIHHKWTGGVGEGWSGWENIGGITEQGVAACSWGWGRTDLFHRGMDRAVYHKWFENGWSEWERLGGVTDYGPTAASRGAGLIDVMHVGTDKRIYLSEYSP